MATPTPRAVRLALASALALVAVPASGQAGGGPPSRTVTVPLPNGSGVFYYRAGGDSSGVRIRSRTGPAAAPALEDGRTERRDRGLEDEIDRLRRDLDRVARLRDRAPEGTSRLDLLALERDLLDAIDRRLARRAAAPVAAPAAPPQVVVQQAPSSSTGPTVREVERAILETGLFNTTEVNFEFAKADLLPTATATLDVLADVLRRYPELRVEVGGHTDDVDSDAVNLRLSQRRAESVLEYLVGAGVGRGRLSAVGYGEERPTASNETETGRALNRRVEFVVLNPDAARATSRPATEADELRRIIREEIERAREDG